jgi:hypothetical protein
MQGIHGTAEFDEQAVARGLDDPPIMPGDAGSISSARTALSRSSVPCSRLAKAGA